MTQTPVALIRPSNRLFGTMDFDPIALTFPADQLPSTYYMTGNGPFIRLRPLHKSGFLMSEKPTRVVGLYTGNWAANQSFQQNTQGGQIFFFNLGTTEAQINASITQLKQNPVTTQDILNHNNNNNPPPLNNAVVYVQGGAMTGTIWGGNTAITNDRYQPMKVADATTVNDRAHHGHYFADSTRVEQFYADNYPATLQQLMQLGQAQQNMARVIGPNQAPIMMPLETNVEYFPISEFGDDRQRQLTFMLRFIASFV